MAKSLRGSRVRFKPPTDSVPGASLPPAGVWYVVDQAPGQGYWWLKATDLESQHWASTHPAEMTSGCISAHASKFSSNYLTLF